MIIMAVWGVSSRKVQKELLPPEINLMAQEYGTSFGELAPNCFLLCYMSPSAIKSAAQGNCSSDSRPYSKPVYSVSHWILKRYSPGAAWASKPVTMDYLVILPM